MESQLNLREDRIPMHKINWKLAMLAITALTARAETHRLKASPETIVIGHYWSEAKPALRIKSGDAVEIETISGTPARLAELGVPKEQIPPAIEAISKSPDRGGPGGHILTGPVYIEGAEPGDVLEVRIRRVEMTVPWAINSFRWTAGFLQEDFPYSRSKLIHLDRERMMGRFADGV